MANSYVLGERLRRSGTLDVYRAARSSHGRYELARTDANESDGDDLANTPIQTIELCCELLRIRSTLEADVVARMQRALARLRDLSELLRKYEGAVPWRTEDGSIDSIEQLQQSVPQPQPLTSSDERRRARSFRAAGRIRGIRIRRAGSRLG